MTQSSINNNNIIYEFPNYQDQHKHTHGESHVIHVCVPWGFEQWILTSSGHGHAEERSNHGHNKAQLGDLKSILMFASKWACGWCDYRCCWMACPQLQGSGANQIMFLFVDWRWWLLSTTNGGWYFVNPIPGTANFICLASYCASEFASDQRSLPPLVINNKQSLQIGTNTIDLFIGPAIHTAAQILMCRLSE